MIQICQSSLENLTMAGILGSLQLLKDACTRKTQTIELPEARCLFRGDGEPRGRLRLLRGFCLLLLNRFGFPTTSHISVLPLRLWYAGVG
jgi:hypothetical protein